MRDLKRSFVLMLMQIFFFKFVRLNHKTATSFTLICQKSRFLEMVIIQETWLSSCGAACILSFAILPTIKSH